MTQSRNYTGAWLVLGLLVALVVAAVCVLGISAAALGAPSPTSSTSTRSTP